MLQLQNLLACDSAPAVAATTANAAATFESSTATPGLLLTAPVVHDALAANTARRPRAVGRVNHGLRPGGGQGKRFRCAKIVELG